MAPARIYNPRLVFGHGYEEVHCPHRCKSEIGMTRYAELSAWLTIPHATLLGNIFLPNDEHVHPLTAAAEDELGVRVQITGDVANTAAGSGLHDADCWPDVILLVREHFDQSQNPSSVGFGPCHKRVVVASSIRDLCRSSDSIVDRIRECSAAYRSSFPKDAEVEYLWPWQLGSWLLATHPASLREWQQKNSQVGLDRCSWYSMVVDNSYLCGVPFFPKENKTPLLIHSDTPESGQITR
jgi:hypothetical protein